MDETREFLEESLTRISALSDVLWVASLNPEYLQPTVIIKVSAIIQELAQKSIESLGGLVPPDAQEAEAPGCSVACQ